MKHVQFDPTHTPHASHNASTEAPAHNSEQNAPTQHHSVYRAGDFRVTDGANFGDSLGHADELELADIYGLTKSAERVRLAIEMGEELRVGEDSETGSFGAHLHLDCTATFMTPDGSTLEALILVETDNNGNISNTYILPFTPLSAKTDYALVMLNRETARTRLAEVACVSFTRGTRITLANGMQVPIENLRIGDKVLTRNNGAREIRWIGQQTMRATGAFAPIVIKAGALNNDGDLTVSPNHRLFIYQRHDAVKAGRAEVLVKARLLTNGINVLQSEGGFVDYFQLLFDTHEIIYAEGIAAESMFVDGQVKPYLPREVQDHISDSHSHGDPTRAFELRDGMLEPAQAAKLLRDASTS